eukprot:jgi/Chlat1/2052/Chrsp17S02518
MRVDVVTRSGRVLIAGIELPDSALVEELNNAIYTRVRKYHPSRQRLTVAQGVGGEQQAGKPVALQAGSKLLDYFPGKGGTVVFKDLGPQVGWSTVFFWEYFGPLVIFLSFWLFRHRIYAHKQARPLHEAQTLGVLYCALHYAKRILETLFLHRFSHGTMPLFNLFKNCGYYWAFSAYIAYFLVHPLYTPVPKAQIYIGFALALLSQASNLYCHLILANLRPPGSKEYKIPRGFLFEYVTCANYTTEIYGWLGFNIATQTLSGYLFMLAGAAQMVAWAQAKHSRLRKTFDGKEGRPRYPRRWVILPLLL